MQAIGFVDLTPEIVPAAVESVESQESEVHRMRALRRKARRVSAYARWTVMALNSLALEVESDLAILRH